MKQKISKLLFSKRHANANRRLLKWYIDMNTRPVSWEIGIFDKCLCIAPHPDDETIGMGGTLARYAENFSVVCLTGGGKGIVAMSSEDAIKTRRWEFKKAMHIAGIKDIRILELEDRKCIEGYEQFSEIDLDEFDIIFTPNLADTHRDHRAASILLAKKLARTSRRKKILIAFYEVWSALGSPNRYIDITAQRETKQRMLGAYEASCASRDYAGGALGMNAYRGMVAEVASAEAFWVVTAETFCEMVREVFPIGRNA